jgi:intracellular sulfur oxidation DsrE/DsrF family protein
MKKDIHSQLIAYLEGSLLADEVQTIEQQLANSPELRREFEELKMLLQTLDAVPMEQPSPRLRQNFDQFLQNEPRPTVKVIRPLAFHHLKRYAAAAVIVLAVGLGFATLFYKNVQQQQQINALVAEVQHTNKLLILKMLQEESASQRIKAVNTAVEEAVAHPQVIRALIHTLHTDENVNVRMKAAEGLAQFARRPEVVDALTEALRQEKSPEVQITLIDILTNLKAYKAKDEFKKLLQQKDVMKVVKEKAAAGVEILM